MEGVRNEKFIYLTTTGRKTGKPHTVELWFAFARGKLYLSHEGGSTDWMRNLAKQAEVGVRVGAVTSKAKAQTAKGNARELGKRALYEKYYGNASQEVIDNWFDLSTVLELTPLA
jgi:deazaflavin-dependent oxidoreductase (nitroreductase family)